MAGKQQYTKIQLAQKHYWENFKITVHQYRFWILKNTVVSRRHSLLSQTTKQPLSSFEPRKPWKYKQLWGLRPDPSCLLKNKCSEQKGLITSLYLIPPFWHLPFWGFPHPPIKSFVYCYLLTSQRFCSHTLNTVLKVHCWTGLVIREGKRQLNFLSVQVEPINAFLKKPFYKKPSTSMSRN